MRFLKPKTVRGFYRGVLKRNPTRSEISNFALNFARNPDLEVQLSSMIYSREFQLMVMPDLVRLASENFTGRKIFFLHVPKTAGTSVRLAIADALGIPSFSLYPLSSQILPNKLDSMNFWPYWAGHANISAFPEEHQGFTTFRESRSRILSEFRQNQFNSQPEANPHMISKERVAAINAASGKQKYRDFNVWVSKSPPTILNWYLPNPDIQKNLPVEDTALNHKMKVGRDPAWLKRVNEMGELEIARVLEKSLKRLTVAAWLHQPQGIVDAIAKITGNADATLSNENEFKKSGLYREEIISRESLEVLEKARRKDRIVFKIASELGILTDELKIDEDEIFQKSVEKLGFKLP
jgi:hypothetical protein